MIKDDVPTGVASLESRRCAVCLKLCAQPTLCGKCQRRAYCCRECQVVDWLPSSAVSGKGQGHKNWCHLDCGEEDLDWQVVSIPGKGLGVVAKRLIPAKYRIIVETVMTDPQAHPGIKQQLFYQSISVNYRILYLFVISKELWTLYLKEVH